MQHPKSKERIESIVNIYQNMKEQQNNSRIPQPSIINSATGNMNSINKTRSDREGGFQTHQAIVTLNHSKSQNET